MGGLFSSGSGGTVKYPTAKNIVDLRSPLEQEIGSTQEQYFLDLMNSRGMGFSQGPPTFSPLEVYLNSLNSRGSLMNQLMAGVPRTGSPTPFGTPFSGNMPSPQTRSLQPLGTPFSGLTVQAINGPISDSPVFTGQNPRSPMTPSFNAYSLLGTPRVFGMPQPQTPAPGNTLSPGGGSSIEDITRRTIEAMIQSNPQLSGGPPAPDPNETWRWQSG